MVERLGWRIIPASQVDLLGEEVKQGQNERVWEVGAPRNE